MKFFFSGLRIALAVAVLNGVGRAALVYWSFYQFQDAAQQYALFGWQSPPDLLRSNTFEKATELFIPITEEQIIVTREAGKTMIQASYEHPVEYFPNRKYPLKLSFNVEGRDLSSGAVK